MQNHGKSVFDLDANIVAMLCYLANLVCYMGLVLSIITLIQDKTNKLARFHAWQSILLLITPIIFIVVWIVCFFAGIIVDAMIGVPIFSMLLMLVYVVLWLASLAVLIGVIISAIKAYQGEIFKLPIIGNLADRFSN